TKPTALALGSHKKRKLAGRVHLEVHESVLDTLDIARLDLKARILETLCRIGARLYRHPIEESEERCLVKPYKSTPCREILVPDVLRHCGAPKIEFRTQRQDPPGSSLDGCHPIRNSRLSGSSLGDIAVVTGVGQPNDRDQS